MKKSLKHLPENKKDELKNITNIIRELCNDVVKIILFGSYARGDWKEESDLKPGRKSGHASDYDILVVTGSKESAGDCLLWSEVTKACDRLKTSTYARIIVHDIQELNTKLAEGQYFFSDIKKEGRLLFDSGKYKLTKKRDFTPAEKQRIAEDHFDHWFERAENFYSLHLTAIEKKMYKEAAFHLHQSSEASYKAILLVYTNYCPNEHYLTILGNMASEEDAAFENIFPQDTREEKERFNLLDYAYIGARYDPKYMVTKEDLDIQAIYVKRLLELTEKSCKRKIAELSGQD